MTKKIFLISVFIFGVGIFFMFTQKEKAPNFSLLANRILKICSKEEYRLGCYDKEIPKVLEKGFVTMEGAFEVTKKIQAVDRSYLYCHVLGHNIADVETKKNPDKWLDVITRCPTLACNAGCEHGAIMRRFKGTEVLNSEQINSITPDLNIACEPRGDWHPTELERSMCYHSMGHLGMYLTGADIKRSLEICTEIGKKEDGRDYYQTCVQGVFMIIFQSLDQDDAALVAKIKPKKENVVSFCSQFTGLENVACRTEAWPYFFDDFKSPTGLSKFCSFTNDPFYSRWCYDTGFRGGVPRDILKDEGIKGVAKYCLGVINPAFKEYCFTAVATNWVQDEPNFIKESVELCEEARNYGYSERCFNGLLYFSKFSFARESFQWKSYCDAFPEEYKKRCFDGNVPDSW